MVADPRGRRALLWGGPRGYGPPAERLASREAQMAVPREEGTMALRDNDPLRHLEAQLEREDPDFVRAMSSGHPRRPPEDRSLSAWIVVALTGSGLVALGIALTWAAVIVAGLFVLAVCAYRLCIVAPSHVKDSGSRRSGDEGPDGGVGASTS